MLATTGLDTIQSMFVAKNGKFLPHVGDNENVFLLHVSGNINVFLLQMSKNETAFF